MESRQQIARIRNSVLALELKGLPIYIDTIKIVYNESLKYKIPITEMIKSESLHCFAKAIETVLMKESQHEAETMEDIVQSSIP